MRKKFKKGWNKSNNLNKINHSPAEFRVNVPGLLLSHMTTALPKCFRCIAQRTSFLCCATKVQCLCCVDQRRWRDEITTCTCPHRPRRQSLDSKSWMEYQREIQPTKFLKMLSCLCWCVSSDRVRKAWLLHAVILLLLSHCVEAFCKQRKNNRECNF